MQQSQTAEQYLHHSCSAVAKGYRKMKHCWNYVVCSVLQIVAVLLLFDKTAGVTDTYGRHFVFPVPNCDLEYKPHLLVTSARKGLLVELIVAGLFTEIVRTNIAQFTRFELPCRKLRNSGITPSGAISVISSHDVMVHVTYHFDNFLVYPVSSLGLNYTVTVPRIPYRVSKSEMSVGITSISKNTNIAVEIHSSSSIKAGAKYYRKGEALKMTLNDTDVSVVTCFRRICNLHIQGSEPVFVLIWNTVEKNAQRTIVEQIPPDITWGEAYILPLPEWADDQVQISLSTDNTGVVLTNVRSQTNQDQISVGKRSYIVTMVTATDYVHLVSSGRFSVIFLIRDTSSINDTFSLISGVPVGQYTPMACDVTKDQKGLTTIAYEEYVEETFLYDADNSSGIFTNHSSRFNFTVVDNTPQHTGVPKLAIPYLKRVLGAYTIYIYSNDGDGREQLISGGSKLQPPYDACEDVNGTVNNNTICLREILDEITESDVDDPDVNSELFSFIGCHETGMRRQVTWYRGTLKNGGITLSVIAVIISIVVAVIGVIGFIIGLVIIDLTGDQRTMRQTRVLPIEDEPPPPEY